MSEGQDQMDRSASSQPSADDIMRASMAQMPIPELAPAFTPPPPLGTARVAIVTTAGLMRHGEEPWTHVDPDFRVFDANERDLVVGHVSMSFDRVGAVMDRNVFYPLDRLNELAVSGRIGSVAPRHISFMGALRTMDLLSTLILDSGPRAAGLLRDDGVDVVVLTPACPGCARTILVLGSVLEAQGLSTVVLASNLGMARRANTPRALFCDFPLGRPLGKPSDPEFQHHVLRAALGLLERPSGPVLEIFPEVIKDEGDVPVACTLPPRFDPSVPAPVDEARGLRRAWDRAKAQNGSSNVGLKLTPDQIPDAIPQLMRVAAGTPWREVFPTEEAMLNQVMDIRNYYEEAATALAGHVPAAKAAEAWFYRETETGRLLKTVFNELRRSEQEKDMSLMALYYIVPLSQADAEKAAPPWRQDPTEARQEA